MEPATTIISICGGFQAVADMTGRTLTRVHRWTYPKEKGGTNGLIPSDAAQVLMAAARARGLPLEPEHFFLTSRTESALMAATPPGVPGTSTNHESFHETSPDDAA